MPRKIRDDDPTRKYFREKKRESRARLKKKRQEEWLNKDKPKKTHKTLFSPNL